MHVLVMPYSQFMVRFAIESTSEKDWHLARGCLDERLHAILSYGNAQLLGVPMLKVRGLRYSVLEPHTLR